MAVHAAGHHRRRAGPAPARRLLRLAGALPTRLVLLGLLLWVAARNLGTTSSARGKEPPTYAGAPTTRAVSPLATEDDADAPAPASASGDDDDAAQLQPASTRHKPPRPPPPPRELLLPFLETAPAVLAVAPARTRRPVFIKCLPPEEAEKRGIAMVRSARPRNVSLAIAASLELCWRPRVSDAQLPDESLPPTAALPTRLPTDQLHSLFVHRENLHRLGRDEGWDPDDASFVAALPRDGSEAVLPISRQACAVVASGGDLAGAGLGKEIDRAGAVLRVNQAPTLGYERNVGTATAFRLVNNLWTKKYAGLYEKCRSAVAAARHPECAPPPPPYAPPPKGGPDAALPLERNVTLLVTRADGDDFQRLSTYLHEHRPDVTLRLLSSRAVSATRNLWVVPWKHQLNATGAPEALAAVIEGREAPSSGLVGALLMLQLCDRVTVFGFAGLNDSNRYHYFKTPRNYMNRAHSFSAERALLRALHRDGHLAFVHGNPQAVKSWV